MALGLMLLLPKVMDRVGRVDCTLGTESVFSPGAGRLSDDLLHHEMTTSTNEKKKKKRYDGSRGIKAFGYVIYSGHWLVATALFCDDYVGQICSCCSFIFIASSSFDQIHSS